MMYNFSDFMGKAAEDICILTHSNRLEFFVYIQFELT